MDWNAIVNMGSAGAVIAVVMIFLKSIRELTDNFAKSNEKRDDEWRNFFTLLNTNNKDDVCKLAELMKQMVDKLDQHDDRAKEIKHTVESIAAQITKPIRKQPAVK